MTIQFLGALKGKRLSQRLMPCNLDHGSNLGQIFARFEEPWFSISHVLNFFLVHASSANLSLESSKRVSRRDLQWFFS